MNATGETVATLSEFVLARIAEDERWAGRASSRLEVGKSACRRMLAECEAKRRRVALLETMEADDLNVVGSYTYHLLCIEAYPYADHPDFREEWNRSV